MRARVASGRTVVSVLSRRPILSLVTGRGRLPASSSRVTGLLDLVAAAVTAGVDLIQVREPDLPDADLFALVHRCVGLADGSHTAVLVNDRLDIALAARAAGVHLRGGSVAASAMRPHTPPGFLLGRSVHGAAEAAAVESGGGMDYVTFGTVYRSQSKPGLAPHGVESLAAAVRAVSVPVLAIGGVTVDNTEEVFRAGAAGLAAIGLFAEATVVGDTDGLRHVVGAIRRSYAISHGQRE